MFTLRNLKQGVEVHLLIRIGQLCQLLPQPGGGLDRAPATRRSSVVTPGSNTFLDQAAVAKSNNTLGL